MASLVELVFAGPRLFLGALEAVAKLPREMEDDGRRAPRLRRRYRDVAQHRDPVALHARDRDVRPERALLRLVDPLAFQSVGHGLLQRHGGAARVLEVQREQPRTTWRQW